MLVISYNPGYQSVLKDLKQSTRQRFLALEFNYPEKKMETEIIIHESRIDEKTACLTAVSQALTDDREMLAALSEIVSSIF
ncbi:MAG: CbbQ/NirQ/NorQ C-terminal domain-containing protein [Nitrospirae bacterium]|nr:CbbQ/NirQ/NorQ C-terminal domain-containing protein [Nitrospirota bacterium]